MSTRELEHENERDRLYYGIPFPIRELARDNVIVNDMVSRYLAGNIMTLEEFQWQLIRALSLNYEKMKGDYIAYAAMTAQPLSFIHKP